MPLKTSRDLVAASAALLATLAGPALPQTYDTAVNGQWKNFEGRADSGSYVCGFEMSGPDRKVYVKLFPQVGALEFHLTKSDWNIPSNASMTVAFWVDHAAPLTLPPSGTALPSLIVIDVPSGLLETVLNEIRFGATVYFAFPSGSEATWFGSLLGSGAAVAEVARCALRNGQGPTTQPYSPVPTHPVEPQPATQPYRAL